jgi:uncharacterized repeat protein (TIGR01451 family)
VLTLTNVQAAQAGAYSVLVSNTFGAAVSSNAALTVLVPAAITTQPSNQTVAAGTSASFSVTASGTAPLAYQWKFNGTNLPGANASTLLLASAQSTQAGNYTVVVTNVAGSVTSALARLTVLTPVVVLDGFTLIAEGCPNGAVDPTETVTVNVGLKNIGTASTTNLVATLLATNGIESPSGPQTYGALTTNGAAVAHPFTFTASGSCGGTNIASFRLQDGTANLGTINFLFRLGQVNVTTVFSQDFDAATAPALPTGWTTSTSGAQSNWVTSTAASDTAPNSVFSPDPSGIGVNELDSPIITLPIGSAQLSFRHSYNLQASRDGGILEIKIGSGSWTNIATAGGSFVSGGYVGVLGSSRGNPLGGSSAWTGNSGGFINTVINLPAAASGQATQFRWRCGSDNRTSGTGWYVDSVSITNSSYLCCTASADLAVSLTASPDPALAGKYLSYMLAVTNLGPASASSVTLTDTLPASVAFVSASPGCVSLGGNVICNVGSIPSGGSTNFTIVVTPTADGMLTNLLAVASPTSDPYSGNNTALILTTVEVPPAITAQPSGQTAIVGTNVTFQLTTTGTAPLAYQWTFDGANLAGATAEALWLTNVQPAQAGDYAVVISNGAGSITSAVASLTVLVPITMSGASLASPAVSISFLSETGLSYLLEYKNLLDDPKWTPVSPAVPGTGGVMMLQDTNEPAASRYYRLRTE